MIGSAQGTPGGSLLERINATQRYFRERTRLGIPFIPYEEALHGLVLPGATQFPQSIALAASFDTTLMGQVGRAIALETKARGIRMVLSPVVNLATDVRWGRVEETYGEDPLLASWMGIAYVKAMEGIFATPENQDRLLAYIDGIARSLPELKPVRVHFRLDREIVRSMNVHTIIVGNCGVLPGGFLLMPDAKPDDGILDVAALRPRGPFGWAKVWQKVAWENGVLRKSAIGRKIIDLSKDVRDVTYFTTRDLTMTVDVPQEFQLDGDEFGVAASVHTWVDAGALTVMVPRA